MAKLKIANQSSDIFQCSNLALHKIDVSGV